MAIEAVLHRPPGLPGFLCFSGEAGSGKSTLIERIACDYDAAFLYLPPLGSAAIGSWLLRELAAEFGREPSRYTNENYRMIIEAERRESKMIMVDECENGLRGNGIEVLRSIHDLTGCPIVLCGMQGLPRRLKALPQLLSRVSSWIEMQPPTPADCRLLADKLSEVEIADDLLAELREKTRGVVRSFVVGLAQISEFAKRRGLRSVDAAQWARRSFTLSQETEAKGAPAAKLQAVGGSR